MSTPSIEQIVRDVSRPEYWLGLVSGMSITSDEKHSDRQTIGDAALKTLRENVMREGYFSLENLLDTSQVGAMAQAARVLVKAACPPVFGFVFDEFWTTCGRIGQVLETILGPNYRQLPDFWAWHIDPAQESAGWKPHRDKGFWALNRDGSPKSMTVWIPLTEATPLNGCMYVVPAHLDPPSRYEKEEDRRMPASLQDVRALPAKPGTVLGWNQSLLHWGARSSRRATEPRISFACEFQQGGIEPFNRPLLDPSRPPPFELRLALIGKQILQYRHMYGLSDAMSHVAERLKQLVIL